MHIQKYSWAPYIHETLTLETHSSHTPSPLSWRSPPLTSSHSDISTYNLRPSPHLLSQWHFPFVVSYLSPSHSLTFTSPLRFSDGFRSMPACNGCLGIFVAWASDSIDLSGLSNLNLATKDLIELCVLCEVVLPFSSKVVTLLVL